MDEIQYKLFIGHKNCVFPETYGTKTNWEINFIQNIIDLFQQRVLNQQPKETQYGCLAANTLSETKIENSVIQSLLDDFFKGMQGAFLDALLRDQKNKILKADIDCKQCAEFLVTTALGLNVLIRTKGDNKAGVVSVNAIIQCINSWRV